MGETISSCPATDHPRLAVVGAGRMGTALTTALPDAAGPFGRGFDGRDAAGVPYDVVLLCVPDREIARAAACIRPGPYVGHCSGITGLDVLAPHRAFSLHPLTTVTGGDSPPPFAGAGCAIAGSTTEAHDVAAALARRLGMTPTTVADADRAVYHAAASVAANFLVTVEAAAERLAAHAGVDRAALAPLVRAAVDNWARQGAGRALTGPIARGDDDTVRRQRAAVAVREPDLLPLFDALTDATRDLAGVPRRPVGDPHTRSHTNGDPHTYPDARGDPHMKVVRTVEELRRELRPARRAGRTIGLVPTMGSLHEGHLSLIRRARDKCDVVVMSLFVNPAQFDRSADLAAYPRDEERDVALAEQTGVDIVFAPPVEAVYPDGFVTSVHVTGPLTETLEGAHRGAAHFHGVTTVVTKLLNMVGPDVAYFGQKDAQQALVVRRLVRDLDLPARVEVCPIVREPDGLAMSSRNVHLRGDDRKRALALRHGLDAAEASVHDGVRDATEIHAAAVTAMGVLDVEPEYVAVVDPETLEPLASVEETALVAVAARVGDTRLIDNELLSVRRPR